jgi:hypothetical protein
MIAITNPDEIQKYTNQMEEMTVLGPTNDRVFADSLLQSRGWTVVGSDSEYGHLSPAEIRIITEALGSTRPPDCIAVATENLEPLPSCYRFILSEAELEDFNNKCAGFRYMIMDDPRTWAITCTTFFKLYAGPPSCVFV